LVKQARSLLEESIRIDSTALEGAALNGPGVLYYKVPAWPVGFGDKSKAAELLLKSLAINPHGVDANFFYGEFLVESAHPEEAISFLERALNVPLRPDRQIADAGRREEIRQLLEKARRHY
jgi:Tfp pilus assembly protein PilF